MKKLSNVSISDFRKILAKLGCTYRRTKGGHEAWRKEGIIRPIIFQTHIDPIPEMVIKNAIRDLGITKEEFLSVYNEI